MKLTATANPRESQGELGQFPTAPPVAVERLGRSLGIPRKQIEAQRWRLPDGSGFYPPRYRWCLLMKAIIEHFCPAFAPGGVVLYIGDTENKFVHLETAGLTPAPEADRRTLARRLSLDLTGLPPAPELVELLSNEKQVTKETPPCFIWHTWEDNAVKVENSLEFAAALRKAGVPFDLHVYQKGGHGMGLGGRGGQGLHPWTADCLYWLKAQGFAK